MRALKIKNILLGILVISLLGACKKTVSEKEFIADDTTFSSFKSWPLVKTYYPGYDSALHVIMGNDTIDAHANLKPNVTRRVYVKDGQKPVDGQYPVGTLIVKYSYNPDYSVDEYTALAKRGNGFNPGFNDWEFFMLSPDGKIMVDPVMGLARGADLMGGMCKNCHNLAPTDLVFSAE